MGDDFPDLHHKLCKKLAHLTTGFYFLSMKNDENELIIQNVIETYEKEMDELVRAAQEIVDSYIKDNPQYKETHEILMAYKEFKLRIEQERLEAIQEFKNHELRIREREESLQKETEAKLKVYQEEVDDLKTKLKYMKELVEKVVGHDIEDQLKQNQASKLEEKRLQHELEEKKEEIAELKTRNNELERMYRELEEVRTSENWSRDMLEDRDSVHNILKSEIWVPELLRKKVIEQEKLIFVLRNALGQESGLVGDHDNIGSIELGGNSNDDASGMSIQVNALQRELQNAKSTTDRNPKGKNEEIEKFKDQVKEGFSEDKMQSLVDEYENKLKEANIKHKEMVEMIHNQYDQKTKEMEKEFEEEKKKWETVVQGLQATLDSRNEYINGLEDKIKTLQALEEKLNEEKQSKEAFKESQINLNMEIQRLSMVIDDSRRIFDERLEAEKKKTEAAKADLIEQLRLEKQKSLERLKVELDQDRVATETEKEKKIKELEAELVEYKDSPKPSELAEKYQNKLIELSQQHNNYVRDLLTKHDKKVDNIEKIYERELNALKTELLREKENVMRMKDEDKNSEIVNVKKEYEAKLHKISKSFDQQLEEKLNEYEAKLSQKDADILNQRKETAFIKEQLKAALKRLDEKEANYRDLEKIFIEQKNSIVITQAEQQGRISPTDSVVNFKDEILKAKDGTFVDKEKEEIMQEHLAYARKTEKMLHALKRQHEEKVQLLFEKYNELYKAYESRPSRPEDIALINQLQDDYLEKESVMRKMTIDSKVFPESTKKDSFAKVFSSQSINASIVNGSTMLSSMEKGRKSQAKHMSPAPGSSIVLPPISISQFTIQYRSPPGSNGIVSTKKFFKKESMG